MADVDPTSADPPVDPPRNLLLVDSRLPEYEQLVAAVNAATIAVTFDAATDTYASLLEKIAALGISSIESIAVAQHGTASLSVYRILDSDSAIVAEVEFLDPELNSWEPITTFLGSLATTYQVKTIDLLGCALYANQGMVYALTHLDTRLGVQIRASIDDTGNVALAANWTLESDNVDVKNLYFTEAIHEYNHLFTYVAGINNVDGRRIFSRNVMITAETPSVISIMNAANPAEKLMERDPSNCYISTLGRSTDASLRRTIPNANGVINQSMYNGVVGSSHFVLKSDKTGVVWGLNGETAGISAELLTDISDVVATEGAFSILKTNDSMLTWGTTPYGGFLPYSDTGSNGVKKAIAAGTQAFAAIYDDATASGRVVAWGVADIIPDILGTTPDISGIVAIGIPPVSTLTNPPVICLRNDGNLLIYRRWGDFPPQTVVRSFADISNISDIVGFSIDGSILYAFRSDESLVMSSHNIDGTSSIPIINPLGSKKVKAIASAGSSSAATYSSVALCKDGSVARLNATSASSDISGVMNDLSGVVGIASNIGAYAALRSDGAVITWGTTSPTYGADSLAVQPDLSGVVALVASRGAFAALRSDGRVIAWGDAALGGSIASISSELINIVSIAGNVDGFAALRSDGRVIIWGNYVISQRSTHTLMSDTKRIAAFGTSGFASFKTGPSVPDIPTVTTVSGEQLITLNWVTETDGGSPITGYNIYDGSDVLLQSNVQSQSATFTQLTPSQSYSYKVTAVNAVGESPKDAAIALVTRRVLGPPLPMPAVTARYGNGQMFLSWSTPTSVEPSITSFNVYNETGTQYTNVSFSVNSATISGLTNGVTYGFQVKAVNSYGEGAGSPIVYEMPRNAPGIPTINSGGARNGRITLGWTAPTAITGVTITGYKIYNANDQEITTDISYSIVSGRSATVSNLTNGVAYRFKVAAFSGTSPNINIGALSALSPEYTPGTTPTSTPTIGTAVVSGNLQASVSFTPPESDGGGRPLSYLVTATSSDGGTTRTATGTTSPITVSSLTSGRTYTFRVRSTNGSLDPAAPDSAASNALVASTFPGAPTNVSAVVNNQTARVSWTPPVSNGNSPIIGYSVLSNPHARVTTLMDGSATMMDVSNITPGVLYTFKVRAITLVGQGTLSAFSSNGIVLPNNTVTLPSAPTALAITPDDTQIVLSWSPPAVNGGGAITSYSIYDGSDNLVRSNATSPATITGLTNGITYRYKVAATNSAGEGPKTSVVSAIPFSYTAPQTTDVAAVVSASTNTSAALSTLSTIYTNIESAKKPEFIAATTSTFVNRKIADSSGATTQTRISNVAAQIIDMKNGLPSGEISTVLASSVAAVTASSLTAAEKISSLVVAMNTVAQTSTSHKSTLSSAIQTDVNLAGAKIPLTSEQTTALLASLPAGSVSSPPTSLSVIVPSLNIVTLPEAGSIYTVMTPGTSYLFEFGGITRTVIYDATLNRLLSDGSTYAVGDAIQVGMGSFQIFATGSAGLNVTGIPCFPPGVMIRTPTGDKRVETLKTGDKVVTSAGRVVPVRMHSYSLPVTTEATAPYFIPAHALGHNAPAKPLHLSPLHAFQVRPNVWWCAKQAAKATSKIEQYAVGEPITYYHVECPHFLRDNLVADGVVVESFAGDQLTKTEARNLYTFDAKVGGYVRQLKTASTRATR